jgi:hypothetical protein
MYKVTKLDEIAVFFGSFSHASLIVLIFLVGISVKELKLKFEHRYFFEAVVLMLFSIVLNLALKYSFAIPLPEERFGKDAFAFPSGHMLSVITFYGWLALRYNSKLLYACVGFLFAGIIFGMFHFEYHNARDILGAFFFGALLLSAYSYLLKKHYSKINYVVHISSVLLLIYIYLIHHHVIIMSAWLAFLGTNLMMVIMKKLYPKN